MMRLKSYLHILLFTGAMLCSGQVLATHIFGGELLYAWAPGNSYALKLTLYGDCSAVSSTFSTLYTSHPLISIYRGNTLVDSIRLQPESGTGIEVSPVCPSQTGNTTCNGGTLPGVTKFVYTGNIIPGSNEPDWRFVFNGDLGGTSAGRSSNISNISAAANINLLTLVATLNNTAGPNSSPEYNTIPTPFYALNLPQEYNQGAVDPNGDSLGFSLIAALDIYGHTIPYVAPATASAPLYTAPGEFSFDGHSGQMSFLPNALQDALVTEQVTEYRNGLAVGSSMREMTFIVLDNLGSFNNIQHTQPVNLSGGNATAANVIASCGTALDFDIQPRDTAQNDITVSYTSLPPGAAISVAANGTPAPTLHFSWDTGLHPAGSYIFYVIYKNNACPISTSQTIAYTVNVAEPYTFISATQSATGCADAIPVTIVFAGRTPASLVVSQQGNVIRDLVCQSDTVSFTLPLGDFTATLSAADKGCPAVFNFSIADSTAQPCCHFSYPSAFTPNNDGLNDRFRIVASSRPVTFEMIIYDRWGNKVFYTDDPDKGWDGTYRGRACNTGVYFYRIYAHCQERTEIKKGDVTLLQ
ncbi:MAG: hypothetical protein BGO69_18680 [Bacteroidetes bacterium 46-16]|nr:MAG: hypothetical protein BGO69_18680 [Bacteroidetes bacterium 46-16]